MAHLLIGISPNRFPPEDRHFYKGKELEYGDGAIAGCVRRAGALAVLLYRSESTGDEMRAYATRLMERMDGLVLTGGADIAPAQYSEDTVDPRWAGDPIRDAWELALYHAAIGLQRPVLGICRGAQLINVAEGGTLWQDLLTLRGDCLVHRSQELYCTLSHPITVEDDSVVSRIFDTKTPMVNSVHHQAVREVGSTLRVTASAEDGVIEAVEREGSPWVVGTQWHPEWMPGSDSQIRLFNLFLEACRR